MTCTRKTDTILTNITSHSQVVTGILNAVLVYTVAYHVQLWTTKTVARWARFRAGSRSHRARHTNNNELVLDDVDTSASARTDGIGCSCTCHHHHPNQQHRQSGPCPRPASAEVCGCGGDEICGNRDTTCQSCPERFRKHISDVSTLCTLSGYTSDSNGPNTTTDLEEGRLADPGARLARRGRPADALWVLENSFPSEEEGPEAEDRRGDPRAVTKAVGSWVLQNVLLVFSLLLFLLVGLPLSFLHDDDLFLDIGFIFTVWLTFTSAQTRVKQHVAAQAHTQDRHHPRRPRRMCVATLAAILNPVLWTSLSLLCYALAKARLRNTPTASIVAQFKTGNSISDLIAHHVDVSDPSSSSSSPNIITTLLPVGAGDLATSVLNAGIVSWGLKLFEYRAHLLSRGGLTVLVTTAAVALVNVVAWPLLAARVGVRPGAGALSFAARSVTIALGGPAVDSVGGDAGINAVGVVVNGICFQLGAVLWLAVRRRPDEENKGAAAWKDKMKSSLQVLGRAHVREEGDHPSSDVAWPGHHHNSPVDATRGGGEQQQQQQEGQQVQDGDDAPPSSPSSSPTTARNPQNEDDETDMTAGTTTCPYPASFVLSPGGDNTHPLAHPADSAARRHCHYHHHHHHHHDEEESSPTTTTTTAKIVANGVTVGINAAAMGTSHLYEQNSPAAAYSALSMTTFGVFTLLFTVPSPLTAWLVSMVGG